MTKTNTSVSKKPKKKDVWAGARRLMKKPVTEKEQTEQQTLLAASRVLGVSPFGVNVLGGMPYINKLGLRQKLRQLDQNAMLKYKWVQYARDDKDKAICKCKVVSNGEDRCDWIVGECSRITMSMSTLAGYQNHMAQTRAGNRAIQEAFGVDIHIEMMSKLEDLYSKVDVALPNVSVEEIQNKKAVKEKVIIKTVKPSNDFKKSYAKASQKRKQNNK